jgi:capsule polysaccharide modification protein KpsS
MSPFCARLARELKAQGLDLKKINFNGGDFLYFPRGTNYRGLPQDWPAFLEDYIRQHRIDLILLYGDSRPIHVAARAVAKRLNVRVMVFEEGYIRPNFITLEEGGTNYHSSIPVKLPRELKQAAESGEVPSWVEGKSAGATFGRFAWYSAFYSIAIALGSVPFRKYRHHKSLALLYQSKVWVLSWYRRYAYPILHRGWMEKYTRDHFKNYYLVPLQVHNDFQVQQSEYQTVPAFIVDVMESFAAHAPSGTHLVFKHHPMDRGEFHYQSLIDQHAERLGLQGCVGYLHDEHLPTLLRAARGVVTINSTVGLSDLFHETPTFCTSHSIYKCVAAAGTLADFWTALPEVNAKEVNAFRHWLRDTCQVNGSFYRRTFSDSPTGMRWPPPWSTTEQAALSRPSVVEAHP